MMIAADAPHSVGKRRASESDGQGLKSFRETQTRGYTLTSEDVW
jgi:hypothetical protein